MRLNPWQTTVSGRMRGIQPRKRWWRCFRWFQPQFSCQMPVMKWKVMPFEFGQVTSTLIVRSPSLEDSWVRWSIRWLSSDSVFFQDIEKSYCDVFTAVSHACSSPASVLPGRLVCIEKLWRVDRGRRSGRGGHDNAAATCNAWFLHFSSGGHPRSGGCCGVGAWGQEGDNGRVISCIPRCRGYWHHKFPHQVAFHARLDLIQDARVHVFNNPGRGAWIRFSSDFTALHQFTSPVASSKDALGRWFSREV